MDQTLGRVADDGTVFVRMPDGSEHQVGIWAAGDAADGLAYYRRRYDDLVVEVDLMRQRLKSGNASPEDAEAVVTKITEAAKEPTFVGDVAALQDKITALTAAAGVRREELVEIKAKAKKQTLARRTEIADEAEQLGDSTQWKSTGQRYRDLLEEWKALPRFDKAAEQAQWERFSHARSRFDKARRQHFAELDANRAEAVKVKQELVRRAEAMSSSTDWGATSREYRDLMSEWKLAPRAGRDEDDKLWAQFRAAQEVFFTARDASNAERSAGEVTNLAAKLALVEQAEALADSPDHREARKRLGRLMDQWETIGYVPRDERPKLEHRLRAVEHKLRDAEQDHWRRTDPAAKSRAESTVESFRASVAKLEKQRATAEAAGDDRRVADLDKSLNSTRMLLEAAENALSEFV